jgi:hypothetical protein
VIDTYSEEWRRECEAREHLKRTNGEPIKINALLLRIAARRGQAAADQLREQMRRQYQAARSGAGTTTAMGM